MAFYVSFCLECAEESGERLPLAFGDSARVGIFSHAAHRNGGVGVFVLPDDPSPVDFAKAVEEAKSDVANQDSPSPESLKIRDDAITAHVEQVKAILEKDHADKFDRSKAVVVITKAPRAG